MKNPFYFLSISGLVVFYLVLGVLVLNPNVSEEYSSYYIKRSTNEWRPAVYSATLSDGVDFSKKGLPDFIKSVSGISGREDWGRWTDATLAPAARIVYRQSFSGSVCVALKFVPATSQEGKSASIRIGEAERHFVTDSGEAHWYVFNFTLDKPSNFIEVEPASPAYASKMDRRKIGIGLQRIIVIAGSCDDL